MNRSLTATTCLGLALLAVPASVSAQTSLNKRVTIDVTAVPPRDVVALLARAVGCTIGRRIRPGAAGREAPAGSRRTCRFHVDPAVTRPLTMRLVDVPVDAALRMICQSIACEYRFDGTNVWLEAAVGEPEAHDQRDGGVLPEAREPAAAGHAFRRRDARERARGHREGGRARVEAVQGEGDRKVTLDVGGKTVNEALEAVVRQIDGEGVVMIRSWQGSMAQYRVVPKTLKAPGRQPPVGRRGDDVQRLSATRRARWQRLPGSPSRPWPSWRSASASTSRCSAS